MDVTKLLSKYILLKDKRIIVRDHWDIVKVYKDRIYYIDHGSVGTNYMEFTKSHDNVLMLAEKDDLVEAPRFDYASKRKYYGITKVEFYVYDQQDRVSIEDEFGNNLYDYVEALWKNHQGEMTRYSVIRNELDLYTHTYDYEEYEQTDLTEVLKKTVEELAHEIS